MRIPHFLRSFPFIASHLAFEDVLKKAIFSTHFRLLKHPRYHHTTLRCNRVETDLVDDFILQEGNLEGTGCPCVLKEDEPVGNKTVLAEQRALAGTHK